MFLFLTREAWVKHSWSRVQGSVYNVVFIKQNCLVGSTLKMLFLWHALKRAQQKILCVPLGIESYLNVMLWTLRSLKNVCVTHTQLGRYFEKWGWGVQSSAVNRTGIPLQSNKQKRAVSEAGWEWIFSGLGPSLVFAGQGQGIWDRMELLDAMAGSILQESICRKACWAEAARYHLWLSRSRARVSVPCRQGIWLR